MRRNVRRLNREIGHHSASLTNPTAVIPLSVPSSYQPRKAYEKKNTSAAVDVIDEVGDSVDFCGYMLFALFYYVCYGFCT